MANEVQALIKINDFGKGDMDSLKKHLYHGASLIHMHQVDGFRLDANMKNLDINEFIEYTANKEADITLVYFNTSVGYAKKHELKYGLTTSKRSILFGMDLECKLAEENKEIKDGFFNALCKLINENSDEESSTPSAGDSVELCTIICSDEDVLDWYEQQEDKSLKVNHVDYATQRVFVENCEYSLDMNELVVVK